MFLNSSVPSYAVAIIIVAVVVQYAYALFCLLKLAYLDIPKKNYVLWNLLILLAIFIGPTVFLVYYYKSGKDKKIPPYVEEQHEKIEAPQSEQAVVDTASDGDKEQAEQTEENKVND